MEQGGISLVRVGDHQGTFRRTDEPFDISASGACVIELQADGQAAASKDEVIEGMTSVPMNMRKIAGKSLPIEVNIVLLNCDCNELTFRWTPVEIRLPKGSQVYRTRQSADFASHRTRLFLWSSQSQLILISVDANAETASYSFLTAHPDCFTMWSFPA